jgi:hypothetical protein
MHPPQDPQHLDPPMLDRPEAERACIYHLSGTYGTLHLLAQDGTLVTLQVAQIKQRLMIAVYIDGHMPKYASARAEADLPADLARWTRKRSRYIYTAKRRAQMRKMRPALRRLGMQSQDPDARQWWLEPFFGTPGAAVRHVRKQRPTILNYTEGARRLRELYDAAPEVLHGA